MEHLIFARRLYYLKFKKAFIYEQLNYIKLYIFIIYNKITA